MPTVLRWEGYRAFFTATRAKSPHVHVVKDDSEVKIWLDDLTVAASVGFASHEVRAILNVVQQNERMLREAWNEHFGN